MGGHGPGMPPRGAGPAIMLCQVNLPLCMIMSTKSIPMIRGGVEDTRLEAKAKDTKKIRGQRQPFRGQILSRPRTKDTGASVLQSKKSLPKQFSGQSPKEENKKDLRKIFREVSGVFQQNFNDSKNSAVLDPRTRAIFEDLRL